MVTMLKISRLIMLCSLMFIFGCGWLGVLDTYSYNNPHQYACDKQLNEQIKQKVVGLEQQLFGLSKEEVVIKMGKPKPSDIKFGYPYLADKSCFGPTCQTIISDEAWYYEYNKTISFCGEYSYSIIIYFKNNRVARVE